VLHFYLEDFLLVSLTSCIDKGWSLLISWRCHIISPVECILELYYYIYSSSRYIGYLSV